MFILAVLALVAIIAGPFLISDNAAAQALFGVIMTAIGTGIGIWTSWHYSKSTDKERLTRYGLLAWRNVDALSVKVRQQIQNDPQHSDVLQSWLLDIDSAKWAWRDLLREVFELQERLTLEKEEVALDYKKRIEAAPSSQQKQKLEEELRVAVAKIRTKAPLPLPESVAIPCPRCGALVTTELGTELGATKWPECTECRAQFPVHRAADGDISVNSSALKAPVERPCPSCGETLEWKIPVEKDVRFLDRCEHCGKKLQCSGAADNFEVALAALP